MSDELGNNSSPINDEIEIDIRELIKIFRKWSKLIAVMTLGCVLVAGIISFFVLSPVYQSQTLLLVTQATSQLQSNRTQAEGLDDVVGSLSRIPVLTMNTYLGQLTSEALLKRVIDELNLDSSPQSLAGAITATVVKDSNLIEVKVQNNDPVMAARIANSVGTNFLQLISEKNQEQMTKSVSFLEEQQEITDQQLQAAVDELKKFQQLPRSVAVLEQEFAKKSDMLATLDARRELAGIELRQLQAGAASLEEELYYTSQYTQTIREDPVTHEMVTIQEINPVYVSLSQDLGKMKAELSAKQAEIEGLENTIIINSIALDNLQAELAGKRLEQDRLQSQVDRLKETFGTLAQKTTETQISKSINLGDTTVTIMSEASIPTSPIKPNKKLNMAIAMVLGLMVFTGLAFLLEYLDNTIKTPDDVAAHLDLPVLGVIPLVTSDSSKHSYGG
ncbi:MAG: GumC family protein [Syntrophomonadales bacterium]